MISDRELSALVAEKVMGWSCDPCERKYRWLAPSRRGFVRRAAPRFATDAGLALEAAMRAADGDRVDRSVVIEIDDHAARFRGSVWWRVEPSMEMVVRAATGSTTARALCLAALRAAGVEVEDDAEAPSK